MATHSSVLAWRIPGTGEPGGLPSMGSHRVGHDWSDLAAAGEGHGGLACCSPGGHEELNMTGWLDKQASPRACGPVQDIRLWIRSFHIKPTVYGTSDILSQILSWEWAVLCIMGKGVVSLRAPSSWEPRISPDVAKCPLGTKPPYVDSHWSMRKDG